MSRRVQFVVGALLALFFVWLFLRQADLGEVREALAGADPWLVTAAVGLTVVTALQRAWRWRMLLSPIRIFPMRPLLDAILMGWTVTLLLPGRLGEIARPVFLSRKQPVRATAAFGTVVLERVFDAATVLVLMAIYMAVLPPPPVLDDQGRMAMDAMRTTGLAALVVVLLAGVVAMLALRSRAMRQRIESFARERLPTRLAELGVSFLEGLSGLGSPWLVLRIAGASLVLWVTILGSYVVLFHALDLQLPWYASIPVLVLLVVGVMVPTPGAVGSFHKAGQIGLVSLWNVDNELAVAWAILSHSAAFVPLGVLGLVVAVREGLRPGDMSRMQMPTGEDGGAGAV